MQKRKKVLLKEKRNGRKEKKKGEGKAATKRGFHELTRASQLVWLVSLINRRARASGFVSNNLACLPFKSWSLLHGHYRPPAALLPRCSRRLINNAFV